MHIDILNSFLGFTSVAVQIEKKIMNSNYVSFCQNMMKKAGAEGFISYKTILASQYTFICCFCLVSFLCFLLCWPAFNWSLCSLVVDKLKAHMDLTHANTDIANDVMIPNCIYSTNLALFCYLSLLEFDF